VIFFQIEQSTFLTAGNIVNLLVQAAAYILFGVAEIFALLLSEIDLSVGYTAAVGAFIIAEPDRLSGQPPVVDRDPSRARRHRGVRRAAGDADHEARSALVRGHAGRCCCS